MQINVVGMLDRVFQTNAQKTETVGTQKKASADTVQSLTQVGKNKGVIRTKMNEEGKKSQIYEGEKKKENEFDSQLAAIKEQLDIMINQMSGNDYAAMQVEGVSITSSEMEKLVTVVDQIKVRLAAYNDDYQPAGDISKEDLEAVLGSAGMAAAVSRKLESYDLPVTDENIAEISEAMKINGSITEVTREQAAYLVKNQLEPTIQNVYRVQHSGVAITVASEPLTEKEWEQLSPQVESVITESGEEVNEENLELARWLIERGIALNKENFSAMTDYIGLSALEEGEQLDSILASMAKGKSAEQTSLFGEQSVAEAVTEVMKALEQSVAEKYSMQDNSLEAVTARRQLEEIRLMMTSEAGISLLKSGIEIQTEDLQKLVEDLKQQEQEYYQKMYKTENLEWTLQEADIVKQTEHCRQELSAMPSYLIGEMYSRVISLNEEITLQNSLETGRQMQHSLERAGESYDVLMTRPDKEYGDNIRKAFRNIDDLLEEIGEECTEQNERCVRILAYNQMEITKENLNQVRALDSEYQFLLSNLTPRVTMHMVQKKINPLNMEIHDLNDEIEEIKEEIGLSQDEKYSEFLWKLEQQTELSEEERAAYIGVYRLLHTINRQDYAGIGMLVKQGADITLENLLTAARTKKSGKVDVKIDDVSEIAEKIFQNNSITEQLKLFYEEFSDDNYAYQKQMAQEWKMLREDTKAQQMLLESGQAITTDNLKAASVLTGPTDKELKKYWEKQKKNGQTEKFYQNFTGKSALFDIFEEVENQMEESVKSVCEEGAVSYSELEELRLYYHTAQLMTNLARQEEYHIPFEYKGEMTNVHLKVIHNTGEDGKVSVETTLPDFGKITAEFSVKENQIRGFILGDSAKTIQTLEGQKERFIQSFEALDLETKQLFYTPSKQIPSISSKKEGEEQTDTAKLYDVAKAFLTTLKNTTTSK